jgi:threonine aldolase
MLLSQAIEQSLSCRPRTQKPGCISITQATECGTLYTIHELMILQNVAKKYQLPIHMDGARFANALVTLGCKPADITWKVGIDVLSLGATKNGAFIGELLIFFNDVYVQQFDYVHRRAGQLMAKTRYIAAQLIAYFKDDLWLKNALYTNKHAQLLASVFSENNIDLVYPVQANELFVYFSDHLAAYLIKEGVGFYEWSCQDQKLYRFVTLLCTTEKDIGNFACILKNYIK